jgi:hypothetical protein
MQWQELWLCSPLTGSSPEMKVSRLQEAKSIGTIDYSGVLKSTNQTTNFEPWMNGPHALEQMTQADMHDCTLARMHAAI